MLHITKRIIKRSLQHIAANFGRHQQKSSQPKLLILMYHRILPADDERARFEEPGMMVTPETFDLHMQIIKQYFEVISLAQWIQKKENNETLPKRACVITFDDGWLDNYQYAYPLLKKHQLPATIFLVADMIGSNSQFWPERIARLISYIATQCPQHWSHTCISWLTQLDSDYQFNDTAPDREQLSHIIAQLKSRSDDDIHRLIDEVKAELQLNDEAQPSLLNWQQMDEMHQSGLVDAGSHTCHHIRLKQQLEKSRLTSEIIDSKSQIEKHLKQDIDTFCYPNGDHSTAAVELVSKHYQCAVTTQKGWNTLDTDNYLLQRIGVHQDISADKTAFLASLSGWM